MGQVLWPMSQRAGMKPVHDAPPTVKAPAEALEKERERYQNMSDSDTASEED